MPAITIGGFLCYVTSRSFMYFVTDDMYQNYKVVVNTAAGRRRYMQYLVPPILNADIVDRYDIWAVSYTHLDVYKRQPERGYVFSGSPSAHVEAHRRIFSFNK